MRPTCAARSHRTPSHLMPVSKSRMNKFDIDHLRADLKVRSLRGELLDACVTGRAIRVAVGLNNSSCAFTDVLRFWSCRYDFRGAELALRRIGRSIVLPVIICLAGVAAAESAQSVATGLPIVKRLLVLGLAFSVGSGATLLAAPAWREVRAFKELSRSARSVSSPSVVETRR